MLRHMVKSAIIVGTIAGVLLPMFAGDAVTANNTGGEVMAVAAPAATLPPLLKITTEGLHRLTGNLKVVDPDRNVIEIAASNVTLDLNGYTISGPAVCSYGTPVTCTHSTNIGNGIYASVLGKPLNLTIMNGSIHGMASYAILSDSETAIRVERST